jgi:hypothetical protein
MTGRRPAIALATAAVAAGGVLLVTAIAADDTPPPPEPTVLERAVAAGRHWRLESENGPVHVWVPAGYHADGAATILYVHGYYTDVDKAWDEHRLPEQFALSSVNAMFIAPSAPGRARHGVSWPELTTLLTAVAAGVDVARPQGVTVAVGHSGAYRTLHRWFDHPALDLVIAVDSVYDDVDELTGWLATSPEHRLIVIGDNTLVWTEELARELGPEVLTLDRFPEDDRGLPPEARTARVLYIRSQLGHMPLVTEGVALPMVLRLVPAEILADGPWYQPYGLPPRPDAGVDAR